MITSNIVTTTSSQIATVKKDDKVRWNNSENGVDFEHFGVVLNVSDDNILFSTAFGEMNVNKDDGSFHVHIGELPAVFREVEIDNSNTEAKPKGVREGSKQQLCIDFVRKMKEEDDKVKTSTIVTAIMAEFEMSNAGAKTYYYNSTKWIRENG